MGTMDRIFVFMVSGIDYKNEHESLKNHLTNRGHKVTFKNDPYSFKRDLYPMMSVISFNWSEVKDINPDTNPKEFQNKLIDLNLVNWFGVNEFKCDWGSVELSDDNEWTPLIQHLKRWVWISSYFRYYKKIQKPSRSRVKSGSTKSWIRTNHYKTHKKFIPYEIVYTPKKVRTRLRNRYSNGCSLQERQIMGFWSSYFIYYDWNSFYGYVLPWGQMSFWAATVITNLASAIPIYGTDIVVWFWELLV